jgi:hypothetical protein
MEIGADGPYQPEGRARLIFRAVVSHTDTGWTEGVIPVEWSRTGQPNTTAGCPKGPISIVGWPRRGVPGMRVPVLSTIGAYPETRPAAIPIGERPRKGINILTQRVW